MLELPAGDLRGRTATISERGASVTPFGNIHV
jgi:hypothetical protein